MLYNKLQYKLNKNKRRTNLKILLYKAPIEIYDDVIKQKIIEEFHNTPHGGHSGVKRTINKIKQRYIWKKLNKMVKNYVNNCDSCTKNKILRHTKERLVITDTPTTSFEVISIDTVGPLRMSKDFRYILTIQCKLSKYIEAIPIENKEATTVARALVEKFILKYGNFKILKTDMGTEFVNELFKKICKLLKIEHITSTPYHHETLGSIERNHRVLNEYLLSFTQDYNWDDWIPYYTFCYNTTPHTDTGYTPYELIFGKLASLPNDINLNDTSPIYNFDDYSNELKFRLTKAHQSAKALLDIAKAKRKLQSDEKANPINIKVGDLVFLSNENRKKNDSPYKGPYEVVELENVNSRIKIGNEIKKVHKNRLKKANNQNKIM